MTVASKSGRVPTQPACIQSVEIDSTGSRSAFSPKSFTESPTNGPIAALQEYVQSSQAVKLLQSHAVLQWHIESQGVKHWECCFRATVAFMLDGVPHHVAGGWERSKKNAQRDAASRALGLFVGRWTEFLSDSDHEAPRQSDRRHGAPPVEVLSHFVAEEFGSPAPDWSVQWTEGGCKAVVLVQLLGTPHQFAGSARMCEIEAMADTARRVLWYLRCPGFDGDFDIDETAAVAASRDIPRPPAQWLSK